MALDNMSDQENVNAVLNIEDGRRESHVYTKRTCGSFLPSVSFARKVGL